jgi:Fic family protein
MARSFANEAGRLRITQNWLTNRFTGEQTYLPPAADDVPHLLDDLMSWLEDQIDVPVAVRAAVAHLRLAGIHPFRDGNGRTARIVASLVMYRGGFRRTEFTSLEEWWGRHLDDYYGAFECLGREWSEGADVTQFVEIHLGAQVSQVEALSLRQATEREIWTALENLASDMRLDDRVAFALFDGIFGRTITNRYYRNLADVSSPTAVADLSALVASGLLAQEGAGRSTSYRGTVELMRRVASELGIDPEILAGYESGEAVSVLVRELARRVGDCGPGSSA